MARLARRPSEQRQEISDSYESQQQELSLSSSDVEAEDEGHDSQLIQKQLTQEQPEDDDDDDDDDDGTVNLFLLDIVNQAATPSKKDKDAQANKLSSRPKSSPIAARSSPRSCPDTQGTQNTQSSTQSDEGHFAHYMRRQKLAQQQMKQKASPLRRPTTRVKPLIRSATPVELPSEGKPDPYEFPASPERKIKPAPQQQASDVNEKEKAKAGGKRKRKDTATAPVEREATPEEEKDFQPVVSKRPRRGQAKNTVTTQTAETPEEPIIARRPRHGQDKPEYSPDSLRKEKAARRKKPEAKPKKRTLEPAKKRWAVPRSAKNPLDAEAEEVAEDEQEHEPEADADEPEQQEEAEKTIPVVELPFNRTRSRKAELEAEAATASSSAQNSGSLKENSYEDSNAIIDSSTSKASRKCASCDSKASYHWHMHLWNEEPTGKSYCNNCYSNDYKKKHKKEKTTEETERAASKPQTALDILSSPPSTSAKASKDAAVTQVPATQSEFQPSQTLPLPESAYTVMTRKKQQEVLAKVRAESSAEVQVSSPIPETPKRSRRAKSSSVAPQSASPRVVRKPRQHFKDTTSPVAPPSASQLAEEPALEPSSDAQAAERKAASPEMNMKPIRTTRQSTREKARSEQRASVEPPAKARATGSRKVELRKELSQIKEEVEQEEPETANFNTDDVSESLFVSQDDEEMQVDMEIQVEGDRDEMDVGEGQGELQVVINDDDSPWEEEPEEEAEAEDEEEDEDVPEEGGVSGIISILMAPSPKKVPSQRIALSQRQMRSQEQKRAASKPQKASTSRGPPPSPSSHPALMEDDEDVSVESQREGSTTQDAADNSDTTMDYGRNPFDEPTFKFTSSSFSATSKCFIKDMLLDPDVRELTQIMRDVHTIVTGVDRKTQQARDLQKLQQFLVADYKAMRAQHNSDEPDEGVICDLYGNIYTNTRKLHKKVYAIIDNDLSDDPEDIANGEAVRRTKLRKKLLRDIYLFIAPDLLKIIRAMMATYCSERAPGRLCFEEIQGVVRITRNLIRTAEDETNQPYRPRQLPDTGNDYHYPEYRKLIKTLEKINKSCDTVLKEQIEYEKKAEMEEQRKAETKKESARKAREKELLQREHEEKRKAEAEKAAEEERIRAEKLRAWQERNASILNQWKGKEVPRQFARSVPPVSTPNPSYQTPFVGSQGTLAARMEEVGVQVEDPFAHDIRAIQPIVSGCAQKPAVDNRPVELRRKPVVAASGRKMPWAQNGQLPQVIIRPHTLPMSNNDSDDDAFDAPQPPRQRRKFVHHPITADDEIDPTANHDDARLMSDDEPLVPMDLDSEEEELPEHPVARHVPRARIEEEERSLTQQRIDEEQRLKLLKAEAEDIEKERLAKFAAIAEVERRKAELEIQEREYYATRDGMNENFDVDLDDLKNENEQEELEAEDIHLRKVKMEHAVDGSDQEGEESQHAEDEVYEEEEQEGDIYGVSGDEDDQPDEGTAFFPGNNNKPENSVKPWSHADLSELITHLKFYEYKNKYIEAASSLCRSLDDVIETAIEHKEDWAEEYLRQGADVPMWVKDIGKNVA